MNGWMDPWMDTLSQEPHIFRLRSWVWSFPRRLPISITFSHTLLYEICWILFFTTYFEYLPCAIPFWIFFFFNFTMNSFSWEVFLYQCPHSPPLHSPTLQDGDLLIFQQICIEHLSHTSSSVTLEEYDARRQRCESCLHVVAHREGVFFYFPWSCCFSKSLKENWKPHL